MRLVIARCKGGLGGRLSAPLPMATRLLIVKAYGSVLVHSDGGSSEGRFQTCGAMVPTVLLKGKDAVPIRGRRVSGVEIECESGTLFHGTTAVAKDRSFSSAESVQATGTLAAAVNGG